LEDTKIRHYKIEDRTGLRSTDPHAWDAAYHTYLADIGCPRDPKETSAEGKLIVLDWLLGYAVSLEYSDTEEKMARFTAANGRKVAGGEGTSGDGGGGGGGGAGAAVLDEAAIRELGRMLKLTDHPDTQVLLRAVSHTIRTKLKPSAVTIAAAVKDEPIQRCV
jgi:RLL motif-containing protein 1